MTKSLSITSCVLASIIVLLPFMANSFSSLQVSGIKVKKILISIGVDVYIDEKLSRDIESQLLCELDAEQNCNEEIIVVLNYGTSAKTSISARSLQLSFNDGGIREMPFDTTFPAIPCALKTEIPQALRDFLTTKIAIDSSGMGTNKEFNRKGNPLKLELKGVVRK